MHDTAHHFDAPQPGTPAFSGEPQRSAPSAAPAFTRMRAPKRLYRNPDGPLGGVAAGIGDYLGLDPVILRIAFLLAALSGFGLAVYLVCWVMMPRSPRPPRRLPQPSSFEPGH